MPTRPPRPTRRNKGEDCLIEEASRTPSTGAQLRLIRVLARETRYFLPDREVKRLQRSSWQVRSEFISSLHLRRDVIKMLASPRADGGATSKQIWYWIDLRVRSGSRPSLEEVEQKYALSTRQMASEIQGAMKAFNTLRDQQGRTVSPWRLAHHFYDDDVLREAHRKKAEKKNQRAAQREEMRQTKQLEDILNMQIDGPDDLRAQKRAIRQWDDRWIGYYDRK